MKNIKCIAIFIVTTLISSCSSTMKSTWTKSGFTGKKFNNILVVGATRNLESRTTFENYVVKLLGEKGITAHTSLDIFPPIKDKNELNEEKIIEKIKNGNYDAVMVASLVDVDIKDVRETNNNYGGVAYVPRRYGYSRYIYSSYTFAYSPDYYRQQKTYVVESRLFDTSKQSKEDALMWSGQSNITDPSSYESASKQYAKKLVKSLLDSKMIQ